MQKLIIIQPHKPDPESVDPIEIDASRMVEVKECEGTILVNGCTAFDARRTYEFAHKAIYLDFKFDWVMGKDSDGIQCLVPLEKP